MQLMINPERDNTTSYSFRKRDQAVFAGRTLGRLAAEAAVEASTRVISFGVGAITETGRNVYDYFPEEIDMADRAGKVAGGFIRGVVEGLSGHKTGRGSAGIRSRY